MSLNLSDILLDFPHVSLAASSENAELLDFYHQTELKAKKSTVIYRRGEDFFRFLKERSEHFLVFTLKDKNLRIQGMAVISFRPGYVNGELTTVGYLGDLRVNLNRGLIREWRKFYAAFLKQSPLLPETKFCRYYQTALMLENAQSKNNLANTKIANLYYKNLIDYRMVNIIGRFKFRTSEKTTARWANLEDREKLIDFLKADHKKRLFGHDWASEFDRRISSWGNFNISDYIIVSDESNHWMAATSVWNPIQSKQIIVPTIPPVYKLISKAASLLPGIELKHLPEKMVPIEILYLNQISFNKDLSETDRINTFKAIVDLAFERPFSMLAYCDFDREALCKKTKGLITQTNHLGLYSVHYKNEDGTLNDELFLNQKDLMPAFDMALV